MNKFEYSVPSRKTLVSSAKSIEKNNVDEREKHLCFIKKIELQPRKLYQMFEKSSNSDEHCGFVNNA